MYTSVIIPTYNRCDTLRHTLASLLAIDCQPGDHEIIVIDNGSTDRTREVIEEAAARCQTRPILYFYEPVPGLLSGRHRGALEARGDICAYLDDDVRLGREWLNGLKEAFRYPEVALAGGPSAPLFETAPPEWLGSFYTENEQARFCGWLSLFEGGDRVKDIDPIYVWGLNFAIRRTVLFDLGGFHPDIVPKSMQRYQGDGETGLSLKLKIGGLRAQYHPRISVQHEVPATRLTIEYFEQRAYFQGVCDSYTQVRAKGKPAQRDRSLKGPLRRFKSFVRDALRSIDGTASIIQRRTARAYKAGYDFHQKEVRRDPKLLEWVLRKDYWDYRLPI